MQIWITEDLSDLLLGDCLQVKLLPAQDIRDAFLRFAKGRDMGIFPFTPDYQAFLSSARKRGISGPLIFIAFEPVIVREDLYPLNAMVFSVKTQGAGWVRDTLRVIINLALIFPGAAPQQETPPDPARPEIRPIEDAAVIRGILQYNVSADMPVVATYEIREEGEPVSARGICNIKELRQTEVLFHRFRQALFLRGIRKDGTLKVFFPSRDKNDSGEMRVLDVKDHEVLASMPPKLYPAKDIRLQPNPRSPVTLYVLIPNEPTTSYKVIDISTRGIGFQCYRDLPVGSSYPLTIIVPDSKAVIVCSGTIRFKKDAGNYFRYGAEISPHPWDEEHIASYLLKRELEIIGLLRNL